MAVKVLQGQEIDITKNNPGLKTIRVTLGWDINRKDKRKFDLDSSVFLCSEEGYALSSKHFIFYNNTVDPSGSVRHLGDNKTGEDGEEVIIICLEKLPADVQKIVFAVSIHEGDKKQQSFGQVDRSYLRIMDDSRREELIRFDLKSEFSSETGIIIGEMYQKENEWKFKTEGVGFPDGLRGIVHHHGLM